MFETLPGWHGCGARLHFAQRRSSWPLRLAVCRLLLSRLAALAAALLGSHECFLFNDQACATQPCLGDRSMSLGYRCC